MHKAKEDRAFAPIGVFDSGYGGLTILKAIRNLLPEYDYVYLGDNARAPYGNRSFDLIGQFTTEAVRYLWEEGAPLTILACNTASAKALRMIQQQVLPFSEDPSRRVLGVIRPTVESIEEYTETGHVGVLATPGTISSRSYETETAKILPAIALTGLACPMWVPLVENGEASSPGADYFVQQKIDQILSLDPEIDTLVLGCTHYPLLLDKIRQFSPEGISIIEQGALVAASLKDYLLRHPEMEQRLSRGGRVSYKTTEEASKFAELAGMFVEDKVEAERVRIG